MSDQVEVLRTAEQFTRKHHRMVAALIKRAVQNGQLHERPADWLQQTIDSGQARAVLSEGSLLGFFAIEALQDASLGEVVYGSACLWRTSNPESEQLVHQAVLSESARLGTAIYGSFFHNNPTARAFYSAARGWQIVSSHEFPTAMRAMVDQYGDDLVLVRRTV